MTLLTNLVVTILQIAFIFLILFALGFIINGGVESFDAGWDLWSDLIGSF